MDLQMPTQIGGDELRSLGINSETVGGVTPRLQANLPRFPVPPMDDLPALSDIVPRTAATINYIKQRLSTLYSRDKVRKSPIDHGVRGDFARIARRLLGQSIGLVLGGGGARGIAHVGLITAFEEAGIPIDMVGGTSIGAFVGSLYASDNHAVSLYGRAKSFAARMFSKWRLVLDFTYPTTSWTTGAECRSFLRL